MQIQGRWKATVLIAVIAIAPLLAACSPFGDDDDEDAQEEPTTAMVEESPTVAEAESPAAEADESPSEAASPAGTTEESPEGTAQVTPGMPPAETPAGPGGGTPQGTPAMSLIDQGEEVFTTICSACHGPEAEGNGPIPALAGNQFVTLEDPVPVIQVVLTGRGGMPTFNGSLTDEQIAGVISYIRQEFGNDAAPVDVQQIQQVQEDLDIDPDEGEPEPSG